MSLKPLSRQSRYNYWRTKDPNGPGKKRFDLYVSPYHWALFRLIRDCGCMTQNVAAEHAVEALCLQMIIAGKIPEDAFVDLRTEWWQRETEKRAANDEQRKADEDDEDLAKDVG